MRERALFQTPGSGNLSSLFMPCFMQVLHVHPAGVPEDAHGRRQADGTCPGPHLSDAPHTVRHEVSQNSLKTRQKIPVDLLLYL